MGYSFLQATNDTSDLTTYTFSSQNLGTASSDRHIIVVVESRKAGAATTISSITIGGITADIVLQQSNSDSNSNIAGIAIANVPTGTTGDIVITFGAGMVRCAIQVYSATGLASSTAYDTDFSTASDPVGSLDIPAGGFAIAGGVSNSASSATWTNLTEDHDNTLESFVTVTSASDSFVSAQTALSITCDFASSGSTPIGVFASWEIGSDPEINASDDITITEGWPGYDAEPITVTDDASASVQTPDAGSVSVSVSDDVTLSENTSLTSSTYLSSSEGITISESVSVGVNRRISVSDSLTITESRTVSKSRTISVSDAVTLSESSTTRITNYINASDAVTTTESVTAIISSFISVSDDLTVSESVDLALLLLISTSEEITLTDEPTVSIASATGLEVNTSDSLTVTESTTAILSSFIAVSDDVTLSDISSLALLLIIDSSEDVTVDDSPAASIASAPDVEVSSGEDITITEHARSAAWIPSNYIIYDQFSGDDGDDVTGRLPDTVNNGSVWEDAKNFSTDATAGSGTIESNQVKLTANSSAQVIDSGYSDCTIDLDWTPAVGQASRNSIVFRYQQDGDSWLFNFREENADVRILENIADSFFTRSSASYTFTEGQTYNLKVRLDGTAIKCYVDDVQVLAYSSSNKQNETHHGFLRNSSVDEAYMDNFKVYPVDYELAVIDAVDITEDVIVELGSAGNVSVSVSDDLSITEDSTVLVNQLYVDTGDDVSLSESIAVVVNNPDTPTIDVSEDITLTESTSLTSQSYFESSEDISVSDSTSVVVNQPVANQVDSSDDITISESSDVVQDRVTSVQDDVSVVDSPSVTVNAAAAIEIDASESITISESVSATRLTPSLVEVSVYDTVGEGPYKYIFVNGQLAVRVSGRHYEFI